MKVHLRVEAVTPAHTTFRVFVNTASCGLLTMRTDEAEAFRQIVALAGRQAQGEDRA